MSPWDAALKKSDSVLSDIGDSWGRIFKCDYFSLYLHNWAVLRLCIGFTIGESPRVCSKCSHWYYLLFIWGGTKISSIAIELLYRTDNANFADFFYSIGIDRDRIILLTADNAPSFRRLFSGLKLLSIVFQSYQDDCWMKMNERDAVYVRDLNIASSEYRTDEIYLGRANRAAAWTTLLLLLCRAW